MNQDVIPSLVVRAGGARDLRRWYIVAYRPHRHPCPFESQMYYRRRPLTPPRHPHLLGITILQICLVSPPALPDALSLLRCQNLLDVRPSRNPPRHALVAKCPQPGHGTLRRRIAGIAKVSVFDSRGSHVVAKLALLRALRLPHLADRRDLVRRELQLLSESLDVVPSLRPTLLTPGMCKQCRGTEDEDYDCCNDLSVHDVSPASLDRREPSAFTSWANLSDGVNLRTRQRTADVLVSCSPSPREVGERVARGTAQTSRSCEIVARRERGVGSLQLPKPIANT